MGSFSYNSVISLFQRTQRRHYFLNTQGIIFVIDSSDSDRFAEAKKDLDMLLKESMLKDCPILFVANKQDLDNAKGVEEVSDALELHRLQDRKWSKYEV